MKRLFLFIVILELAFLPLSAQNIRTTHFMQYNPYADLLNPATEWKYANYVGLPIFTNLSINIENVGMAYKNIVKQTDQGKVLTINKFIDRLYKNNRLNFDINEPFLTFGKKFGRLSFSISEGVRMQGYFFYPQTFFKLPLQGNMNYVDEPAEMDKLSVYAMAYNELSFGFRYQIDDEWAIGVRPKFLTGIANLHTKDSYFKLETDPTTFAMRLNYHTNVLMSLPLDLVEDESSVSEIVENIFHNYGFSIDLGTTWQRDEWSAGIAVCDLGFIRWKNHPISYYSATADGGTFYDGDAFYYTGIDAFRFVQDKNYIHEVEDSLKEYFPFEKEELKGYTTATYAKITMEGHYEYLPDQRVSAMLRGDIIGRRFIPSFTVAWDATFARFVNLCATYTILPNSYANIGLGIGLACNGFQFYVATDNVLAAFEQLSSKNISIQTGIVFNWGKVFSDKMILDKEKAAVKREARRHATP